MNLLVNIDVPDLARAIAFYRDAFGLRVARRLGPAAVELDGAAVPLYLLEKKAGTRAASATGQTRDYRRHWTPVHLDVVVDDADQGMTDIVRGADLLDSTPRQILLQQALGLPTPRYLHLPVLLDAHGHKLSKSEGAQALDADNLLPALRSAWVQLGQAASVLEGAETVDTLLHAAQHGFDPARLPASA